MGGGGGGGEATRSCGHACYPEDHKNMTDFLLLYCTVIPLYLGGMLVCLGGGGGELACLGRGEASPALPPPDETLADIHVSCTVLRFADTVYSTYFKSC